jgi:radical SAM protein with 4Fe4S-binding SPASM domain
MIIFSKALADQATVWDAIRAAEEAGGPVPDEMIRFSGQTKPVVMWNITRHCNLACEHCYIDATAAAFEELRLEEGIKLIDELADLKVPMLILTGGEPLLSRNFYAYAFHAKEIGLRTVISTNGTLITPEVARLLKEAGIRYVGVSLDSCRPMVHDKFRGVEGAYERAIDGLKNARDAGLKTGLRVTLTKDNCLYHLVPVGRGADISDRDVTAEERRSVIKFLAEAAIELGGEEIEILSTDSPMDGAYLLEMLKDDPEKRERVRKLLLNAGGCTAGIKVANINHRGDVLPCHFMPEVVVGNIRERSFRDIWIENPVPELLALRDIRSHLKGACGECEYLEVCGGCRQKARYYCGDVCGEDPTCVVKDLKSGQ